MARRRRCLRSCVPANSDPGIANFLWHSVAAVGLLSDQESARDALIHFLERIYGMTEDEELREHVLVRLRRPYARPNRIRRDSTTASLRRHLAVDVVCQPNSAQDHGTWDESVEVCWGACGRAGNGSLCPRLVGLESLAQPGVVAGEIRQRRLATRPRSPGRFRCQKELGGGLALNTPLPSTSPLATMTYQGSVGVGHPSPGKRSRWSRRWRRPGPGHRRRLRRHKGWGRQR